MVAAVRAKSFDDLWRELEELAEGSVGEIVAGEIRVHPRPHDPHVGVQTDLGTLLGGPFRFGIGGPGGWVFRVEPRVRFGDELRVPDLAAWRADRFSAPIRGPIVIVPDWIAEVLSESTAAMDRAEKMPLYAAQGVGHLWLIDPSTQLLEVYRRQERSWLLLGAHATDARVRAEPFEAIALDLNDLWGVHARGGPPEHE